MRLGSDGAQLFPAAIGDDERVALVALLGGMSRQAAGVRLKPTRALRPLIASADAIAGSILGSQARPVLARLFDKSPDRNWALGWHQDRTIAVRERVETPGFTAWTVKHGIDHVVPPFDYLERMLTLRVHLDPVGADNGPLLVAPGSHRLGRVAEPQIAATVAGFGTAACEARAGDVWLYATPILHASARAERPARRRVLQLLYSADRLPGELEWLGV
jgi:phytanoyl-CoA dioxygenase PhyH